MEQKSSIALINIISLSTDSRYNYPDITIVQIKDNRKHWDKSPKKQ